VETVTISSEFQVFIPKSIREKLKLVPGQRVRAIAYGQRIELVRFAPPGELCGILRGLDATFARDEGDRL